MHPHLRVRPALAGCSLALCSLLSLPALASWAPQGAPVISSLGDQLQPAAISDGLGGVMTAWEDYRNTSADIYAQRLDVDGAPLWAQDGVALCTASGRQYNVRVIPDGAGGAIFAWWDTRAGAQGIYAQRVSSAGAALWTPNGVRVAPLACFNSFSLCPDGSGGAIVAWERCGSEVSGIDIYAQRVNFAGSTRWVSGGLVVCNAVGDQTSPGIALADDGSGACIIAWADNRKETAVGWDVYAQQVSAAGVNQWTAGGVPVGFDVIAAKDWPVAVVGDGGNGAIIVWYDTGIGTQKVWAQRVSSLGVGQWAQNGVRAGSGTGAQYRPVAVQDLSGGALIAWLDYGEDVNGDLRAQRLAGTGVPAWDPTGVSLCTAPGPQLLPAIANDGSGGVFAVWEDARSDTAYDVYAQHVSPVGGVQWGATAAALGAAPLYQVFPGLALDEQGGIFAVWQDYRSGTDYDIYATRAPSSIVAVGEPPAAAPDLVVAPSVMAGARARTAIDARGMPPGRAELVIADAAGRAVFTRTLESDREGAVSLVWDARGAHGELLPSGIYTVALRAGSAVRRRTLALIR